MGKLKRNVHVEEESQNIKNKLFTYKVNSDKS